MSASHNAMTKFHSVEEVAKPKNGSMTTYVDHWWLVNSEGKVGIWRAESPLCNRDKRITEQMVKTFSWATGVVQIPVAFVPSGGMR